MYIREQLTTDIKKRIGQAVEAARDAGDFDITAMPEIMLEIPREKQFGEYSTNIAMQLPKQAHKAPKVIAEAIVNHFDTEGSLIDSVSIAGPGFINFKLNFIGIFQEIFITMHR